MLQQHTGMAKYGLTSNTVGCLLGDADLRIAAIALVRDFTVVTGNLRHFQRVPSLRVENWLEE